MKINRAQQIKDSLTMRDVLEHYGYEPNKSGFIKCPFHNEKTASLKAYKDNFYCFGCGAHGDVISFVKNLFGVSFPDAIKKIDLDFALGLFGDHSFEDMRKSHYKAIELERKREREKAERTLAEAEFWAAFYEWKELKDTVTRFAPREGEKWNPIFADALARLPYYEYLLDCAEERLRRT